MRNVAKGPFNILPTAPVHMHMWMFGVGAVLTGLCVGARKGFVTMTVFPCVERCLLFPLRTEGGEADRDLNIEISLEMLLIFLF